MSDVSDLFAKLKAEAANWSPGTVTAAHAACDAAITEINGKYSTISANSGTISANATAISALQAATTSAQATAVNISKLGRSVGIPFDAGEL